MGDQAAEVLKILATIVLVCLVIGLAFGIYNKAASAGDIANEQISELTNTLEVEKYTAYEKSNLSGSDVLGAINQFRSDTICVSVDNGYTTTEYIRTSADLATAASGKLADAKDKTKLTSAYINASDSYTGELMYDSSGTIIIGIQFTKN